MSIFQKLTEKEEKFLKKLSKVSRSIKDDVGDLPGAYNELLEFEDLPKKSKFYKLQSILKNLNKDIVKLRKTWQQQETTKKYVEALKNYESAKNSTIRSYTEVLELSEELSEAKQKLYNEFDKAIVKKISDYGRMLEKLHKFRFFGNRHDAKKHVITIFRSLISGELLNNQFNILLSEITLFK